MSYFKKELARRQVRAGGRRWLFVPYDQQTDEIGPLSLENPRTLGIVLVENPWKAARHVIAQGPYATALDPFIPESGPMRVMVPAESRIRKCTSGSGGFWQRGGIRSHRKICSNV
jgi:hypothetical protein